MTPFFLFVLSLVALFAAIMFLRLVQARHILACNSKRGRWWRRHWSPFPLLPLGFQRMWRGFSPRRTEFANIAEGTRPSGNKTYLADAAIATRYLCVKLGSDLNHIAVCSAITDNPIGLNADEPAAAEDECNVQLFGASAGTLRVVSGAAVTVGQYVATMANGKVQPAVATQFAIGRALNAAAGADEIIEIDPIRSDRAL